MKKLSRVRWGGICSAGCVGRGMYGGVSGGVCSVGCVGRGVQGEVCMVGCVGRGVQGKCVWRGV